MKDQEKNVQNCMKQMIPIQDALDVINGKWRLLIVVSMMLENKRFTEIQNSIPKITPKVLTKELKSLEAHQIILRVVLEEYPYSIEYRLTEYGRTLTGIMSELHKWGTKHRKKVLG